VTALLSVHDLHVYLGESHVLQGISFDAAANIGGAVVSNGLEVRIGGG
jgi:ABC-type histidine transport system ATPase subunit